MDLISLAEIIIGSIVALGILIAGAGYGYGQFFKGRDEQTRTDFVLFNTRLESLTKICNDQEKEIQNHKAEITKLHQDIGRLQGINEEKENKIKDLTDLLTNRDPALGEYIKFGREAIIEFKQSIIRLNNRLDNIDSKFNRVLSEGKIS